MRTFSAGHALRLHIEICFLHCFEIQTSNLLPRKNEASCRDGLFRAILGYESLACKAEYIASGEVERHGCAVILKDVQRWLRLRVRFRDEGLWVINIRFSINSGTGLAPE